MRLEEVKASARAIEMAVPFTMGTGQGPVPVIDREMVVPIADMLITALELARPIIADAKSGPWLERRIREITVNQIDECWAAAKEVFPEAESFTDVPGTRRLEWLFETPYEAASLKRSKSASVLTRMIAQPRVTDHSGEGGTAALGFSEATAFHRRTLRGRGRTWARSPNSNLLSVLTGKPA